MVEEVETQLELHREEMKNDFSARLGQIEGLVEAINERGAEWFEENIQLKNSVELLKCEKVQERFRKEVVAGTAKLVKDSVQELVGWLVDRNLKQWRALVEYIEFRRQDEYDGDPVGNIDDGFEYYRSQILRSVSHDATKVVDTYDYEGESEQFAVSLQGAVARTATTEIGALGLGTAVEAVASTVAIDITGGMAALLAAGLGLYILPEKRRKVRSEFRESTKRLRERLDEVVKKQFDLELEQSIGRMKEALIPYVAFVESEYARMTSATTALAEINVEISALKEETGSGALAAQESRPS